MSAYHHHVCGEGFSVVYMKEKNKRKKVTLEHQYRLQKGRVLHFPKPLCQSV
jgi:hypothetical protein